MAVATLTRVAGAIERWLLLPALLAGAAAWTAEVQHDPFFWDTVQLGSKHAHFFYENGLRWAPLPETIDSGHPPMLGYYLAWVWGVFGKTLAVSHWAMFPFVAGAMAVLFCLGARMGGSRWYGAGLALLAASDPVLAAQSGLVGPDVVLVFFFLLAVWALWEERSWWAAVGVLGLCAVSLRGMMTAVALLAWQLCLWWRPGLSAHRFALRLADLSRCWAFLPGFALAGWFLLWHQQATGWTGFHAASPWASAFEPARGADLLRNIAIVGWRWADFGRVFEWAGLAVLWLTLTGMNRWRAMRPWLLLLVCVLLFLSPSALFYQNLSAHRYFLPGFVALHLLFWQGLCSVAWPNARRCALAAAVALGLASGNLWLYPHGIAMGWDATLAHRPYHALRTEALRFMEENAIPIERTGTAFPNRNTGEHLLLNNDRRLWAEWNPQTNEYALISNVFNDVSPEDRAYLRQHRRLLWRGQKGRVWMELYGPD
ncbi:MAG: hypothetical protein RMJ33_10190 [Saprospiraceae bacterium]|nr:glycosyltransferase family 39 protein [Saprospiraceae bacterium]MDW8230195.1 hypothetical protein [Saprospiraceae bacterium]